MHIICTKYRNYANNANKQCNQIWTIVLKWDQKLETSNDKKIVVITLLEAQVAKMY